jgi:hypothetical protein
VTRTNRCVKSSTNQTRHHDGSSTCFVAMRSRWKGIWTFDWINMVTVRTSLIYSRDFRNSLGRDHPTFAGGTERRQVALECRGGKIRGEMCVHAVRLA